MIQIAIEKIEEFLEDNEDYFDNDDIEGLYKAFLSIYPDGVRTSQLTSYLLEWGVNPLDYMYKIPKFYMYGIEDIDTITIPSHIRSIGQGAFAYSSLKNIIIPSTVQTLDKYSFYSIEDLESVEIGATELGSQVFDECESLKNIKITSRDIVLTGFPDHVFPYNDGLTIECYASVFNTLKDEIPENLFELINFKVKR